MKLVCLERGMRWMPIKGLEIRWRVNAAEVPTRDAIRLLSEIMKFPDGKAQQDTICFRRVLLTSIFRRVALEDSISWDGGIRKPEICPTCQKKQGKGRLLNVMRIFYAITWHISRCFRCPRKRKYWKTLFCLQKLSTKREAHEETIMWNSLKKMNRFIRDSSFWLCSASLHQG